MNGKQHKQEQMHVDRHTDRTMDMKTHTQTQRRHRGEWTGLVYTRFAFLKRQGVSNTTNKQTSKQAKAKQRSEWMSEWHGREVKANWGGEKGKPAPFPLRSQARDVRLCNRQMRFAMQTKLTVTSLVKMPSDSPQSWRSSTWLVFGKKME